MIITQKKPLEEVLAMVGDAKTVAVIGCGLCASTCPEIFSMTEDGVAKASAGPVPAEFCASCQLAMDECPVSAIERED